MLFNSSKNQFNSSDQQVQEASKLLETIGPLTKTISSSKMMHLISKGFNHIAELFCYLLGLAIIAFSFIMNTIFPFHVLGEIISKRIYETAGSGKPDIEAFNIAVKGLVIIIGLLVVYIGLMIRSTGTRKALLLQAGQELKQVEDYLSRTVQSASPQDVSQAPSVDLKPIQLKDFPPTV